MKNLSITLKVIIYVSILGFSCIFLMGYVSISSADQILTNNAYQQINSLQEFKKLQLDDFFKAKKSDINSLANMALTQLSINELSTDNFDVNSNNSLFKKLNSSKYINTYNNFGKVCHNFMSANNIKNVILVEPYEGAIYFEAEKNIHFQTKLSQKQGILTKLWSQALTTDNVLISDMTKNSENDQASFYMAKRVVENGKTTGILIIQISSDAINKLLVVNSGHGETGESYIVGDDYLFRSNSRFSTISTILNRKVNTVATEKALAGNSGIEIIYDYRNNEVLSKYENLDINGLNWALITEIDKSEIMAPKRRLINTILIICLIIAAIMLPVLFWIGRTLSRPLKIEAEFARKLANGELNATLDIYQKDEAGQIADALRETANRTKEVIKTVLDATNNLIDASFQLSAASQDISTGASEQASSIEEVSASMEEMASNIQQNADNAKQTEVITNGVTSQVSSGSDIVLSSVASMEKIADKISIISDIAFQTNILALNASVEAARAGEYGKGFGVVASEVGKLADKTKAAASEINEISKNSVEIAGKTKELMSKLVPSIQNSSTLVQEISAASKEQREAADQINNSIQMLNDISQQNAASAEEMATNSEELSGQAEQLKNVISHFKINDSLERRNRRKTPSQKLITERKKVETKYSNTDSDKGIDIDLNTDDDLDDEFERF